MDDKAKVWGTLNIWHEDNIVPQRIVGNCEY